MTPDLTENQQRIEAHLVEQVANGKQYFKAKYIAEALDISASAVGVNLGILQNQSERVNLEIWSGQSSGCTWLVTPTDGDADATATQATATSG